MHFLPPAYYKGSVSGSVTGPLDSESMDTIPDLETQSLEDWYRIPSQPYEDCLRVREYIVSYYTAVILELLSFSYCEIFYMLSHLYRIIFITQKSLCSLYIT